MATIQRGSGWSIRLVFSLYKIFGYKFTYYLMYPVTFFYFIFASNVKKALKIYYENLGLEFDSAIYFKHLFMFAICMCDRFISKYDCNSYSYEYDDIELLKSMADDGSIFLLSHFGGWASSTCKALTSNTINVVMKEVILSSIKNIEDSIATLDQNIKIIDQNQDPIEVSIKIANALSSKECVAFMADRSSDGTTTQKVIFLGKIASFNINPFRLSYRRKIPTIAIFTINIGMQKYQILTKKIELDYTLGESGAVTKALVEYVKILEEVVKKYPQQWFNLYDFWQK